MFEHPIGKGKNRKTCDACLKRGQSAAAMKWARNNRPRLKQLRDAKREADPQAHARMWRNGYIRRTYGISIEQYDALLAKQGYACALCGREHAEERRRRLAVDHDHRCCPGERSCGKCVRALLCIFCNTGIGFLQESPDLIVKAATYVRQFRGG